MHIRLYHTPHNPGVDLCVSMNKQVSETDDFPIIGKLGFQRGIAVQKLIQCLANDLELSLYRRLQQFVSQEVLIGSGCGEAL